MQVSHMDELDSHAVIGGGKALAFGISDSPEFFTILSKTLYRDEKLAMVRETICNADDAHKMVDKTDVAIEITLTQNELIIKDFGPGIPDDKIQPIFCVYGNSTKVKDDKATGGFGLGCKSPFAYSDHFTGTSCHGGFKSVYAMSRGGIETQGKPSCTRMVKAPTTETGMTISVPLRKPSDYSEIERLIKRVVLQGGILAKLNGILLPRYDMAALEKTGYAIANSPELHESPVYVRYGAVLYPVTTENPEITKLVNEFRAERRMSLIIQAPPGSVGVTPSREALSYSEQTIITLKGLLASIKADLQHDIPYALKRLCKERVEHTSNAQVPVTLTVVNVPTKPFITDRLEIAGEVLRNAAEHGVLGEFRVPAAKVAKTLMLAAAAKYRDHRRLFRHYAHAAGKPKFPRAGSMGPDHGRTLRRMALKVDLKGSLLFWGPHPEGRFGKTPSGRIRYRDHALYNFDLKRAFAEPLKIIVCRGKEQAGGYLAGASYGARNHTVFITVRYFKPDQLAALKAALVAYKIDHKFLDLAPPPAKPKKPKVVKAKAKFFDINSIAGSENPTFKSYYADDATKLIDAAPYFIDMKTTITSTEMYQHEVRTILKQRKLLQQVYPNIALAYGQYQKKALIAAGSKPLIDVVAEDIRALKDTPAMQFIANAAGGDLTTGDGGRTASQMACDLAAIDLRFAKLLTRQKVVVSSEELKAFVLFRVSGEIAFDDKGEARKHALTIKQKAMKNRCTKTDFDYLQPLSKIWGYCGRDESIEFNEDLMETIRFLQKRFDKTAKSTQPEPMKEAA